MLILRTSDKNRQAWGGFQWPESGHVEAPDWNPTAQCGNGLHGLALGRGDPGYLFWGVASTWQVVEVDEEVIVDIEGKVKFPYGEVVYSGEMEGALALIAGGVNKIREWICQDPRWAYRYAFYVDGEPRDDTRASACKDPYWAYHYSVKVDKGPHEDTRAAACKDPAWALRYALHMDKGPRDDTRTACCKDPHTAYEYSQGFRRPHEDIRTAVCTNSRWAYRYAHEVDKGPRDDTRAAACASPAGAYHYACSVDKGPHPDTRKAAHQDPRWGVEYDRWFPLAPEVDGADPENIK
jgi:hypothetical protein